MAQEDILRKKVVTINKRGVFLRENKTKVAKTSGDKLNSLQDFGSEQVTI